MSGLGRQPLLAPAATHVGTFWLMEAIRWSPRTCSYAALTVVWAPSSRSISILPCSEYALRMLRSIVVKLNSTFGGTVKVLRMSGNAGAPAWVGDRLMLI